MAHIYKIGDIVKCINADHAFGISLGRSYSVVHVQEYGSILTVINNRKVNEFYQMYRFVLDKEAMRNKTINELLT